ncbi:MAG: YibE/F family protein [Acutalibacteraceae bacterium]|jgi:uncharacterized membrane protein
MEKSLKKLSGRCLWLRAAACLAAVLFAVILTMVSRVEKTELVSTAGRTFEKAVVVRILKDNLAEDGNRYGNQKVLLRMSSGALAGQQVEATSPNGTLFGAVCRVGMRVVVISSVSGESSVNTVFSQDREWAVWIFVAVFLLVLCVIGGRNGIKAALALVFTVICVFCLLLPLIYRGVSPFLAAALVALATTVATMFLIGGISAKSVSAVIGSVSGVLIAGVAAWIFGICAGLNGYNVSEVESLIFVGQSTNVRVGELLFAGIIISSLGAVMDVAMSISSAIGEIHETDPSLSAQQLFRSGMAVGRDMMGTMSNTLILAFAGGSLAAIVLNYSYDLPYLQLINSSNTGIELMQGISGSLGVILTVPVSAFVAAELTVRQKKIRGLPSGAEREESLPDEEN